MVLDNVRATALDSADLSALTQEEEVVRQLIYAREAGVPIRAFPYPYPDIVFALPSKPYDRTFETAGLIRRDSLVGTH